VSIRPGPQGELLVLDSPLLTEVRGEQSLMAYPFFALTKTAWKKSLIYKTDAVTIEIGPGPRGVATIYDKEVLLYIASLLVAKLDAGEAVAQDFYFTAHDLFVSLASMGQLDPTHVCQMRSSVFRVPRLRLISRQVARDRQDSSRGYLRHNFTTQRPSVGKSG